MEQVNLRKITHRSITDIMEENIRLDKQREEEYKNLSMDFISFLKNEIAEKNIIIRKYVNTTCKEEDMETGSLQDTLVTRSSIQSNSSSIQQDNANDAFNDPAHEENREVINDGNYGITYSNYEKDDVFNDCQRNFKIDDKWITERRKKKARKNVNSSPIKLNKNYYTPLQHEDMNIHDEQPFEHDK